MMSLAIDDPAYFERLAGAEAAHWWHAAMWRIASGWLDRALRGRTGLVAIDVGCGPGGTMRRLATRSEIARVAGVDPSRPAVSLASCEGAILGSALALPFADRSIDVATCFDVLQHLPPGGDLAALGEISRVLRPGGVGVVRSNGAGLWPDASRAERPYRLGPLTEIARRAGLIVRRATYANALPAVVTEILGRIRSGSVHGHPQGGGLRIRARHPLANRWMGAVATAEALAVTRLNLRLPVGHSTMMLVEKPGGPKP